MPAGQMLATGARFPDFVLPDAAGREHHEPSGRSIILFYRGTWCPLCQAQISELALHSAHFRRLQVPIVAISTDEPASLDQLARMAPATFRFLADQDGEVIVRLGLRDPEERERGAIAVPSAFLLDSQNIVQFHYRARSPEDRPKVELLMLAAERLR